MAVVAAIIGSTDFLFSLKASVQKAGAFVYPQIWFIYKKTNCYYKYFYVYNLFLFHFDIYRKKGKCNRLPIIYNRFLWNSIYSLLYLYRSRD